MVKAYVLIVNESGTEDSIISNLNNIPTITDAFSTFGTYDILTKLVSSDEQNIQYDISNGIKKISNIRSTLTLLVDKKLGISKTNEIVSKKIRKIPGIKSTITINVINNQGFSHL